MNCDQTSQSLDERLIEWLADHESQWGECLAGQGAPPIPGELPPQLERCLAYARALNEHWPANGATPPDGSGRATPSATLPFSLGRFAVRDELGAGGFGIVFLAHDPLMKRDVALKVP